MSLPGIDYSFARPSPSAIHAAGYRFVVRYLDSGSKGLTRAEAEHLAAAGLWIAAVYETTADWMLGGHAAGVTAAKAALELGTAAGMPKGRPVYFGADFDASAAQLPAVDDCLDGAASVLGREATGVYGGLDVVQHAMDAGAAHFGWQTLAWSGGLWCPKAQMRQVAVNSTVDGAAVDIDEAMADDFGQWQPGKVPAKPAPAPEPPLPPSEHWKTLGLWSLAKEAAEHHTTPAVMLELARAAGHVYGEAMAEYIRRGDWSRRLPERTELFAPKRS